MNKNPKGYIALVTVLIISAVVLVTASPVSLLAIGEAQSSFALYKGEENLHFVEGCLEDALLKARASNSYNGGTITRPEGTCIISVAKNGPQWTITATSTATTYNRTVQATINRAAGITLNSWKEVLPFPTPTLTPTPIPISGLVGYWKLNETSGTTAADSSGRGNTGTLRGNPTRFVGNFGGALACDGVDDAVEIPASSAYNISSLTVSAWINKQTGDQSNYGMIVHRQYGTEQNDQFNFNYADSPGDEYQYDSIKDGSANGDVGRWVHMAATSDGVTDKLYINGVLVASGPQGPLLSDPAALVCIGAGANDSTRNCNSEFANAIIDEVRMYNRALSATEIQALYNGAL